MVRDQLAIDQVVAQLFLGCAQVKFFGVDFSGASDGGKYIWVAEGRIDSGKLLIESCQCTATAFLVTYREQRGVVPRLFEEAPADPPEVLGARPGWAVLVDAVLVAEPVGLAVGARARTAAALFRHLEIGQAKLPYSLRLRVSASSCASEIRRGFAGSGRSRSMATCSSTNAVSRFVISDS